MKPNLEVAETKLILEESIFDDNVTVELAVVSTLCDVIVVTCDVSAATTIRRLWLLAMLIFFR